MTYAEIRWACAALAAAFVCGWSIGRLATLPPQIRIAVPVALEAPANINPERDT